MCQKLCWINIKIICIPGKNGFSFSLIFSLCEKCFFLRISFFFKTFSFKKTGCRMRTMVINIFSNISPAVKWLGCAPCSNWRGDQIKLSQLAEFRPNKILIISSQQTTTKAEQGRTCLWSKQAWILSPWQSVELCISDLNSHWGEGEGSSVAIGDIKERTNSDWIGKKENSNNG